MSLFKSTFFCDPATPDKVTNQSPLSVRKQLETMFCIISSSLWGGTVFLKWFKLFGEMSSTFLPDILGHVLQENSVDILSSTLAKPASETTWTIYRKLSQSKNTPVSKTDLGGCWSGKGFNSLCATWGIFFSLQPSYWCGHFSHRLTLVWTRPYGPYAAPTPMYKMLLGLHSHVIMHVIMHTIIRYKNNNGWQLLMS